jgi:hypothetical protein
MSLDQRIIKESEFEKMKNTFESNIKEKIGEAYSDYVLVPINDLKEYLTALEKKADDNNTSVRAMKIHFAATNDDKGQLTVVLQGVFANDKLTADLFDKLEPCPTYCEMGGLE